MSGFNQIVLVVFAVTFFLTLVTFMTALLFVNPEVPFLPESSLLLVIADGVDYVLSLPRRLRPLFLRAARSSPSA